MTILFHPFPSHLTCCKLLAHYRNHLLRNVHVLSSLAVPVSHDNTGDLRSINHSDVPLCRLIPVTKRWVTTVRHCSNIHPSKHPVLSTTETGLQWPVVNLKSALTRGYSRLRPNVPWLTLSSKAIVEASPLYIQPYLRLIRLDRPIGMCLEVAIDYVCFLVACYVTILVR